MRRVVIINSAKCDMFTYIENNKYITNNSFNRSVIEATDEITGEQIIITTLFSSAFFEKLTHLSAHSEIFLVISLKREDKTAYRLKKTFNVFSDPRLSGKDTINKLSSEYPEYFL